MSTATQVVEHDDEKVPLLERIPGRGSAAAWPLGLAGAALLVAGCFLSWSYTNDVLGDLSINFYPGGVQICMIVLGLVAVLFLLAQRGPLTRLGDWLDSATALRFLGLGAVAYMVPSSRVGSSTSTRVAGCRCSAP